MVTALTDWTYYNGTYKEAVGNVTVPQADFNKYAIKASNYVRAHTFGNIDESRPIIEEVKMCVCELAEALYKHDKEGRSDGIASEKVGEYSVTYTKEDSTQVINVKIREIIVQWLANTGLLYCGVM